MSVGLDNLIVLFKKYLCEPYSPSSLLMGVSATAVFELAI